jgi:hypothetical protein
MPIAGLDLGVAVGTQESAFSGFLSSPGQAARDPLMRHREPLDGGIEVVELQRGLAAVVPAEHAAPTGLRHELRFDPSAPAGNLLLATLLAAVTAPTLEDEHRLSVPWTSTQGLSRCSDRVVVSAPPRIGPCNLPALEPVAHGRDRAVECIRDLAQRRAVASQLLQQISSRGAPWCELAHEHMFAYGSDGTPRSQGSRAVVRRPTPAASSSSTIPPAAKAAVISRSSFLVATREPRSS